MTDPIISIVLMTYNRPILVQRAIKSLQDQTYRNFQVLVLDNGSTDETGSVIRRMAETDERILYSYYKDNNEGLNNYLNEINKINTPYFCFLSDDDWLLPNFFEDALNQFEQHLDCGLVALGTRMVDPEGHTVSKPKMNKRWAGYYEPPHGAMMMIKGGGLTWTGVLFKKELIKNINIWRNICVVNDLAYLLVAALEFPICVSAKEGAVFTHHPESFTTITPLHFVWPCYLDYIATINTYAETYPQEKAFINNRLFQRLRKRLLWTGIAGLYRQDKKTADNVMEIIHEQYGYKNIEYWILTCFRILYSISHRFCILILNIIVKSKPKIAGFIYYIGYLRR